MPPGSAASPSCSIAISWPLWPCRSSGASRSISPTSSRTSLTPRRRFEDLRGHVHAFSDPDSNSGFLVTRALLAEMGREAGALLPPPLLHLRPSQRDPGGRRRAGGQCGSVDGYVLDVVRGLEPDCVRRHARPPPVRVAGFPPIACHRARAGTPCVEAIRTRFSAWRTASWGARSSRSCGSTDSRPVSQPVRRHCCKVRGREAAGMRLGLLSPRSWPLTVKVPFARRGADGRRGRRRFTDRPLAAGTDAGDASSRS